ncbi:hypothetical protein UA08_01231 [Talaromyces atroroseus]|uniref:Cytochrome P450 n=1 Tax=Talaromyces atroroseus TaxID=1441469 RepID=A0A1Q5QAN2_TALAT|nr:hypothetical protein UA08_01231 [Talaromyces atroroseus]OKL63003.1 hypothetical protein UA08_01231 [Talaromyces atroroseus]
MVFQGTLQSWANMEETQSFFETPFDFLVDGFKATSSSIFWFRLFKHEVTAISGSAARNVFFQERTLNLYEGFQVLIGTIPTDLDPHVLSGIYKRLNIIQKPESLASKVFSKHVTFRMIIRAVSSHDIAENDAMVSRLKYFYDIIDSPGKPMLGPLSWIPGFAMAQKLWASTSVYRIFNNAVHERKYAKIKRDDTLQQLLDARESWQCIVGFMMGLPIAGARSTGTIGSWVLIFLSYEEHWYLTVRKEVQALISMYEPTTTTTTESFSGESIFHSLSAIPLEGWESLTPQLDLCIRETLRRAQPHTAVRRNTGPELTIADYEIPSGAFVVYPFSDTLLNPATYPNPLKWDPARHSSTSQENFIGWGGGKHMCKGQRLAKLTMKLVVAYTLMRFDLAAVDGREVRAEPIPDWNDFLTCRPQEGCSINFSERRGWND